MLCSGWIKVNVDAGWNVAMSSGGIAFIIRDTTLYSEWSSRVACGSAEDAETLACIRRMCYLSDNPQQLGILESDCAKLISVLSSAEIDCSAHWSLFLETKKLLNVLLEVKLSKVGRVSNRDAHDLA